tara:strand:+ start:5208 stop:6380 length:1173 start_codon:yes stop_codon:yes gene_type:complete
MVRNSIIWIIGFVIAITSGVTAMGAIAKNKAPELAIILSPTNGFAAEKIASNSMNTAIAGNSGHFPDNVSPNATEFARSAFIAEPITPEAIAILALGEAGNEKDKLMSEALLLSRRQPLVTAWMIADSGVREDMPALLSHYDAMLRTSSSAAVVVIPVLAKALANDDFVPPFASLLAKQPPWANQFWRAVVDTPEALGNAARLREMVYKPNENDNIYYDALLIRALVNNQQFDAAEALYYHLESQNRGSSLLKNASFTMEPEYAPIDWQLFSTGEYGAVVTDGKLQLSAIRNSGGLFVRQLVKLPAEIVTMGINPGDPIPDNAEIIVSLKCAQTIKDAPQTIRIPLKRQITNLQIDNKSSGCSFYWFDITGHASGNGDGFDVALDSISLR